MKFAININFFTLCSGDWLKEWFTILQLDHKYFYPGCLHDQAILSSLFLCYINVD